VHGRTDTVAILNVLSKGSLLVGLQGLLLRMNAFARVRIYIRHTLVYLRQRGHSFAHERRGHITDKRGERVTVLPSEPRYRLGVYTNVVIRPSARITRPVNPWTGAGGRNSAFQSDHAPHGHNGFVLLDARPLY
jgi:hypothetical protein